MKYILIVSLALLLLGCKSNTTTNNSPSDKDTRPNIIFILADDMGYSDLGCYGSEIQTPSLDRLANNGVRFTNFYNAARCCPSRASLLTGQYPHQAGMGSMTQDFGKEGYRGFIKDDVATIAEVLKENDYNTYHVGKWHVGKKEENWPKNKGFQKDFTFINGASSYYNLAPYRAGSDSMQMSYNGERFYPGEGFYMTDAFTDYAEKFIDEDDDKPFFMYLAYTAPHWPLHALPEDIAKYKGDYHMGWDSLRIIRHKKMQELGVIPKDIALSERTPDLPAWNSLSAEEKEVWETRMALYAAVVDRMDQGIGRLMKKLEEKGELENTLIVFLSDNGGSPERMRNTIYPTDGEPGSDRSFPWYGAHWANVSNTPYRYYKAWLQEGGIKSPFIAYWPQRITKSGLNQTTLGHIMDLMATALDAAQVNYPTKINDRTIKPTTGKSLLPAFQNLKEQGHEAIFWEHEGARGMRKGNWKLVANKYLIDSKGWNEQIEWQLFDLNNDPSELENMIEANRDIANKMIKEYEVWMKKNHVLMPQDFFDMKAEWKRVRNEKPAQKY